MVSASQPTRHRRTFLSTRWLSFSLWWYSISRQGSSLTGLSFKTTSSLPELGQPLSSGALSSPHFTVTSSAQQSRQSRQRFLLFWNAEFTQTHHCYFCWHEDIVPSYFCRCCYWSLVIWRQGLNNIASWYDLPSFLPPLLSSRMTGVCHHTQLLPNGSLRFLPSLLLRPVCPQSLL